MKYKRVANNTKPGGAGVHNSCFKEMLLYSELACQYADQPDITVPCLG